MKTLLKKKFSRICTTSLSSLALLTLAPSASAAVLINATDDGTDLTLTYTGSIDRSMDGAGFTTTRFGDFTSIETNTLQIVFLSGNVGVSSNVGTQTGDIVITGTLIVSSHTGDVFGFAGGNLFWDGNLGDNPSTITVNGSAVFPRATVATTFGSNLDAGPVVVWTHTNSGDTVSVGLGSALIPEPSSMLLALLGGASLLGLRQRKLS